MNEHRAVTEYRPYSLTNEPISTNISSSVLRPNAGVEASRTPEAPALAAEHGVETRAMYDSNTRKTA